MLLLSMTALENVEWMALTRELTRESERGASTWDWLKVLVEQELAFEELVLDVLRGYQWTRAQRVRLGPAYMSAPLAWTERALGREDYELLMSAVRQGPYLVTFPEQEEQPVSFEVNWSDWKTYLNLKPITEEAARQYVFNHYDYARALLVTWTQNALREREGLPLFSVESFTSHLSGFVAREFPDTGDHFWIHILLRQVCVEVKRAPDW